MTATVLLLLVTAMIFSGCSFQNNFFYFPDLTVPSEEALEAANLRPWPSSLKDYRGFLSTRETGYTNGTVIIFHGNAGSAPDRVFYVKMLGDLGYRVILAEYPKYGTRKGDLGEKSFVKDADETTRLAFQQFGGPLFLLGESLGCGVVAAVVHNAPVKIDGVILITPWDTLASIARSKTPFLPVRLLLTDRYDNIGNLESFKGRVVVVGAERDEVIPIKHANDLYGSLSGTTRRMLVIRQAGHNNWPLHVDASWWKDIMNFVSGNDRQ